MNIPLRLHEQHQQFEANLRAVDVHAQMLPEADLLPKERRKINAFIQITP